MCVCVCVCVCVCILYNPECIVVSEVGLKLFQSPNNPKREVSGTAKRGRINTQWYTDYLAVH